MTRPGGWVQVLIDACTSAVFFYLLVVLLLVCVLVCGGIVRQNVVMIGFLLLVFAFVGIVLAMLYLLLVMVFGC